MDTNDKIESMPMFCALIMHNPQPIRKQDFLQLFYVINYLMQAFEYFAAPPANADPVPESFSADNLENNIQDLQAETEVSAVRKIIMITLLCEIFATYQFYDFEWSAIVKLSHIFHV